MNFEDIKDHNDLQKISIESIWQNFEKLVAFIFEKNDFQVEIGRVKTSNKKRRQYDVIARSKDRTFLVECKRWSGNRYRLSALKKAAMDHRERSEFYRKLTNECAVPIIVTLIEEEIQVFEDVPLIPVFRLNSFLAEMDGGLSCSQAPDESNA
ncbi:MAG: restriction endonuclease [Methanothrix sp.]|nr:restriction endonuclease [Methanothrix sp.]